MTFGDYEIIEVKFNNGLFAINRKKDFPLKVEAPFKVYHGDTKVSHHVEFYGMHKGEVAECITIHQNLYGTWCKVKKDNGIICDIAPRELIYHYN